MRAAAATTPHYERRRPEQTLLYRMVREHYATFAAEVDHASGGTGLPQFVKDEFAAYLDCGILACGFMRLRCEGCARDTLVAFSCKRRGICASCGTRRMARTPADLVDHVLPRVLKRVFDIDIERCACGGKLKMIAVIEEAAVIETILTHLGLSPQPPPRAKARRLDVLEWA